MPVNKISKSEIIGYKLHMIAESGLDNDKPQLIVTSILSFAEVFLIAVLAWPIRDLYSLCIALICIAISITFTIFLTKCVSIRLLLYIASKTEKYALSYQNKVISNENAKAMENGEKPKEKVLGTGPKAEVSLRYFIEQEKNLNPHNARYLGST